MKAKLPGQGASYSVAYKKKLAAGKKYRREKPEKFRESVKRSKAEHKEAVNKFKVNRTDVIRSY